MEKNQIDVSVIIPIYNTEQYLEKCLLSVLYQDGISIEIICVDDESTDNSLTVLRNLEIEGIPLRILTQENAGAGAARNRGLQQARGRYLYFLDSDDFLEPSFLKKAVAAADETKADVVIFKVYQYNTNSGHRRFARWAFRTEEAPANVFPPDEMADTLFCAFNSWAHNKLFRRSFIEKNEIRFQEIRRTNDLLFVFSALVRASRIALLDEFGLNYRTGSGTNSQATNSKHPTDFLRADMAFRDYLKNHNLWNRYRKGFCNVVAGGMVYNLQSQKDPHSFVLLYEELRNYAIEELGLLDLPESDYFSKKYIKMLRVITELPIIKFLNKGWSKIIDSEDAVEKIKASNSYRIGRFMTFLPRTIKRLLAVNGSHPK